MRRVEAGRAFRSAYREVAAAIREGDFWREPATAEIIARRRSTGGLGNLGLAGTGEAPAGRSWANRQRRRFDGALGRLRGPGTRRRAE